MKGSTLDLVQRMVDQLTPLDQVRLLEYLTPRIAHAVASNQPPKAALSRSSADAWQEFLRIGDALAASDKPGSATLTASVLAMRR